MESGQRSKDGQTLPPLQHVLGITSGVPEVPFLLGPHTRVNATASSSRCLRSATSLLVLCFPSWMLNKESTGCLSAPRLRRPSASQINKGARAASTPHHGAPPLLHSSIRRLVHHYQILALLVNPLVGAFFDLCVHLIY